MYELNVAALTKDCFDDTSIGADQELEACCEHLKRSMSSRSTIDYLRVARRPEQQSLKKQALEALKHAEEGWRPVPADCEIIRRALESLPD